MRRDKSTVHPFPATKIYCEYTHNKYENEGLRDLQKNLPFLDASTGLQNRMLERDPVTGLGQLSMERSDLDGCHIPRRVFPQRDPVRMQGDLGAELNCLYTTKDIRSKEREERDPITLTGDYGDEVDFFRPHGLPRHHFDPTPKRDPIKGTGDFGREWDPIYKYRGRSTPSNRMQYHHYDPITHTGPDSDKEPSQALRHFPHRQSYRNPILHTNENGDDQANLGLNHRRHFYQDNRGYDPITHSQLPSFTSTNTQSGLSRSVTKTNYVSVRITNKTTNHEHTRSPIQCETGPVYQTQRFFRTVYRNPITGEGMQPEDYTDSLKLSNSCRYRSIQRPTIASSCRGQKSDSSTTAVRQKNSSAQGKKSQRLTSSLAQSTEKAKPEPEESAVVKKVIRPKRFQPPVSEASDKQTDNKPDNTLTDDSNKLAEKNPTQVAAESEPTETAALIETTQETTDNPVIEQTRNPSSEERTPLSNENQTLIFTDHNIETNLDDLLTKHNTTDIDDNKHINQYENVGGISLAAELGL